LAATIDKSFKCIEAIAEAPLGLNVSEVVAASGLSRPTVTRLLETLALSSVVLRDPHSKRYRLGLRLYEWSTASVQMSTPLNIARQEMVRLAMDTGRQVNLNVLEDLDGVILERAEEIDGTVFSRPFVYRRRWYQTASTRAMVAFSAAAVRQSMLARTEALDGEQAPPRDEIEAELEKIREQGYATSHSLTESGPVGVPVFGRAGLPLASIAAYIEAGDSGERVQSIIAQSSAAAARISRYLGYESLEPARA
jgi:DNA-binding IclR family transcriptional regulator